MVDRSGSMPAAIQSSTISSVKRLIACVSCQSLVSACQSATK